MLTSIKPYHVGFQLLTITEADFTTLMDGVSMTDIYDIAAESAEQDPTALMCNPILLYAVRKKKKSMVANNRIKVNSSTRDRILNCTYNKNLTCFKG